MRQGMTTNATTLYRVWLIVLFFLFAPSFLAYTKRVLDLVSLAKTNKEIAAVLGIRPATVKRHLENLLRKLGVRNRIEAAIYGLLISRVLRRAMPHLPAGIVA